MAWQKQARSESFSGIELFVRTGPSPSLGPTPGLRPEILALLESVFGAFCPSGGGLILAFLGQIRHRSFALRARTWLAPRNSRLLDANFSSLGSFFWLSLASGLRLRLGLKARFARLGLITDWASLFGAVHNLFMAVSKFFGAFLSLFSVPHGGRPAQVILS